MSTERQTRPTRRWREWVDPFLALVALSVSAVSVWVAIGTEQANRRMVAAASWPLLQADTSDLNSTITMSVMNGGVGPAKLKTFEVFWKGNSYPGAHALLAACCGYDASRSSQRTGLVTGGITGIVIRAGETHTYLSLPQVGSEAVWPKLDHARREMKFRACYCSVFDECWISTLRDLEPKRVDTCPAVKVLYVE